MLNTRAIVSLAQARATITAISVSRRPMLHAARTNPAASWRCSLVAQERRPCDLVSRRWNSQSSSPPPPSSISSSTFQSNREQQQQLAPLGRALVTTTKTLKTLLLFSATTLGVGFAAWSGTHVYLEQYKCPTPQNLSSRVQSLLHGAWVREEYAMDPEMAQEYYKNAIDFATDEIAQALGVRLVGHPSAAQQLHQNNEPPKTKWGHQVLQEQLARQAKDPRIALLEMDAALVEIHHRRARFLDAIGQDALAARIWDRLWRMTDAAEAETMQHQQQQGKEALKRPLMVRASGVLFARRAADAWMRLGRYDEAEEALVWALESVMTMTKTAKKSGQGDNTKNAHPLGKGISVDTQSDETTLLTILGALYARQRRYDDALSLFVRALQLTRQHKEEGDVVVTDDSAKAAAVSTNTRDKWHCREAILMNSIGETLYGSATITETSVTGEKPSDKKKQEELKKSSGGFGSYFWSSSPSASKDTSADKKEQEPEQPPAMVLNAKEQEALGWMQKALALADEKSGKERDCDECAALVLNNLGMIYEMKGDTKLALEQFKNAVVHATRAQDFVGLEHYMEHIARLQQEETLSESAPSP